MAQQKITDELRHARVVATEDRLTSQYSLAAQQERELSSVIKVSLSLYLSVGVVACYFALLNPYSSRLGRSVERRSKYLIETLNLDMENLRVYPETGRGGEEKKVLHLS